MKLPGLQYPVVFDLATMKAAKTVPLLYEHDPYTVIGHNENIQVNQTAGVDSTGVLSGTGAKTDEILNNAANTFPWQVSVGLDAGYLDLYDRNEDVRVNGRIFKGPMYVARNGLIREISFCSMGADPDTGASLQARRSNLGASAMTFEEWLVSLGVDPATQTPEAIALAQMIYDALPEDNTPAEDPAAEGEPVATDANGSATVKATKGKKATLNAAANVLPLLKAANANLLKDFRNQASAERARIDSINLLAAKYGNPQVDSKYIANTAIAEGWDTNKTELAMLKAHRPSNVEVGPTGDQKKNAFTILEAALAQSGKMSDKLLQASFKPEILDQAHTRYKSRIGLQDLLMEGARLNGYTGPMNFKANHREILRANFSTMEMSGIFTNNVNKYMLDGYTKVDDAWRKIAKISRVDDFKVRTGYRMFGGFVFEKLGPDGKIRHADASEASFTNQAETRAKMWTLTRQDQINDDLGALTEGPKALGRGGALALVRDFWTEFMNNSTFFVAGNNNVSTGVLAAAGLGAAYNVFRKLKDAKGEFIMSTPRYLVVPSELEVAAEQLRVATNVIGGPTTPVPETNVWAGKFETVASPYLSDTTITGNSAVAYYLLADPAEVPVIEVAFLLGQETPTIETSEADFNTLGISMRGYFDYGVKKQDPQGGVRSTGA